MSFVWIIVFVAIISAVISLLAKKQNKEKPETERNEPSEFQYKEKFNLLNEKEQVLFHRLIEAMPNMFVLTQVSMSQIFFTGGNRNEVARKSIDFLICRRDTSMVAAIELNGSTHKRTDRIKSDEVKKKALESSGIPLIIYLPENMPDVAQIRKDIAPLIIAREKQKKPPKA